MEGHLRPSTTRAGNMYTEGNSNWVNALMTNNSFQYKLAD